MTTSRMRFFIAAAIVHAAIAASPSQAAMRGADQASEALRCDELVNRPDGPTDGQCRHDERPSATAHGRVFIDGVVRDCPKESGV